MTFEEVLKIGSLLWEEEVSLYYEKVSILDFKFD